MVAWSQYGEGWDASWGVSSDDGGWIASYNSGMTTIATTSSGTIPERPITQAWRLVATFAAGVALASGVAVGIHVVQDHGTTVRPSQPSVHVVPAASADGVPGARTWPVLIPVPYRWMPVGLLERDEQLAILLDRFERADEAGRLVLISGEAGAGKSALVQEFVGRYLSGHSVLFGRCDDLFAARPFGPFVDIARAHGGALAAALPTGDPTEVCEAFLNGSRVVDDIRSSSFSRISSGPTRRRSTCSVSWPAVLTFCVAW